MTGELGRELGSWERDSRMDPGLWIGVTGLAQDSVPKDCLWAA